MNEEPQTDAGEFSEAIRDVRAEMQRDVRGLATATERRPKPKPGVSRLAVVASVLGSLFVGAAGMSLFDATTERPSESAASEVDVRADMQAAMSPYAQQLKEATQTLVEAQQATAEDLKAHGMLLDRLAETVANLERSAEVQNAAFRERVDLLAEELAAKIAREAKGDSESTLAAIPPNPKSEGAAVQPASAEDEADGPEPSKAEIALAEVPKTEAAKAEVPETEAAKTEVTKTDVAKPEIPVTGDPSAIAEKPASPLADKSERGELLIDNPSKFDLKLLINGEPVDIKAQGVTTIAITVGTVKTQIASLPDVAQTWDKWESVDGVKRLTINVESGDDYYKLR